MAGTKNLLPLKNGMTESRNGLASRWLTNRNRATSNAWAQDIELYWKAHRMLAKPKSGWAQVLRGVQFEYFQAREGAHSRAKELSYHGLH